MNPKRRAVLSLVMYVSEMKPPTMVSRKVAPRKLVRVVEEPARSKCITYMKYSTKLTMFAMKPTFSTPDMAIPIACITASASCVPKLKRPRKICARVETKLKHHCGVNSRWPRTSRVVLHGNFKLRSQIK
ncbi:hypothetical protein GW17_00021365 [Ensete ventricosum]|nr:hypothetical protein GW17_00021365 [Ensete ventricosum]